MPTLNFTVDAKLLEELGERLVSKPSIALAELVKNAYDADAHLVEIEFRPEEDRIEVSDDGHGMTLDDFERFWMRIGTTHKTEKRISPHLGRHMTGSKGVGRLAVQLLARRLYLRTVPSEIHSRSRRWIRACVDWNEAVQAGDLTSATVEYDEFDEDSPFEHGVELVLEELKHTWTPRDLKELAREIWYLQPPFRRPSDRIPEKERFEIRFVGAEEYQREFEAQLQAIMKIQSARLVGRCEGGRVDLVVEFWSRGTPYKKLHHTYHLKDAPHNEGKYTPGVNLEKSEFEIRVYSLRGKQPKGLLLDDVKAYMDRFSGVHVYDGGFRLPHYGEPESDWLRLEYDHAHRIFVSRLLPDEINETYRHTARLQFLPTLRRVLGVVRVDTSIEPNLDIAISRDRLMETRAYLDLVYLVRYAFDRYAYDEALRHYENTRREVGTEKTSLKLERVEDVLETYRDELPAEVYRDISTNVAEALKTAQSEQEEMLSRLSLLGPLATAGVSAIAIQHELRKQFAWLRKTIDRLRSLEVPDEDVAKELEFVAGELDAWLRRAKATNAIFDYMTGETIERRERYEVCAVIEDVVRQLSFLARGIEIDYADVAPSTYLPEASYAEWASIFQNVLTNAFNAMQESEPRCVKIETRQSKMERAIVIQDTGVGVDLEHADELFEPFERRLETSRRCMALGYGGTGLGLTIVRLLCERIGCSARFAEPAKGFSTAFVIAWKEAKSRRKRDA